MNDDQFLYCVQFLLKRELSTREILALRELHGGITVTNVVVHPFSGDDWPPIEEFATPRGYLSAVAHGANSTEAAGRLGDVARMALGEGHLQQTKARRLCRYTDSRP